MTTLKIGMFVAGASMLYFLLSRANLAATFRMISNIGLYAPCIVAMYFLGCLMDTSAWMLILDPVRSRIPFTTLLKIHISGESLYRCLPMGAVAGETMKTMLLSRQSRLATTEIVSSLILRKLFLGLSQGLYIGIGVLLGIAFLSRGSFLEITAAGFSLLLLVVFILLGIFLSGGTLFSRIFSILNTIPGVRKKIKSQRKSWESIDGDVRNFLERKRSLSVAVTALFFGGWLTEFFETCLILLSLSIPISVHQAMLFEPVVSLTRSLAFFLPGGIGIMDSGYASVFSSIGIAHAVVAGAAFVLIKRGKEILWIIVGLLLLWFQSSRQKLSTPRVAVVEIRTETV